MRFASYVAVVAFAAATSGCPDDSGGGSSCKDYEPPSDFDAMKPATTFSNDVMPIFLRSCAFSTCHGATTGPANGVFLGRDPPRVHMAIVGVRGDEQQTMAFVTPGNPRESYLMRKIDGSQCALDAMCSGGSCQDSMPKNEGLLDVATRDVIRRWIAQGAKND